MLRWLRLLTVAIATVVCVTGISRTANLTASLVAAEVPSAHSSRATSPPEPNQWRSAHRSVADLKALEAEIDEDDADDADTLPDVADEAVSVRGISTPHEPPRALRGGFAFDTSRFAVDTTLPRGPPV